jgi:aspartate kinase
VTDSIIVQKFGGTSVGSIDRIRAVAEQVIKTKEHGHSVVVVVSAMSGETNRLQVLANQVDTLPSPRELDVLLSAGEQVSMSLLAMTLQKLGHDAVSLTGWQAGIQTDEKHAQARIIGINTDAINQQLQLGKIVIVAGFQGITEQGNISTLGRGGSDTTAVTLAGYLGAKECQIYTDVDGVYSCDPRVVTAARKLDTIGFQDMIDMAKYGAKVLHLPCVEFAEQHNLPIRVLSSFSPLQGTLVKAQESRGGVVGVALRRNLMQITSNNETIDKLVAQCNEQELEVFRVLSKDQSGVVVSQVDLAKLMQVIHEEAVHIDDVCSVSLIGRSNLSSIQALEALLAEDDIEIVSHSLCERHTMMLLAPEYLDKAANIIHDVYVDQNELLSVSKRRVS